MSSTVDTIFDPCSYGQSTTFSFNNSKTSVVPEILIEHAKSIILNTGCDMFTALAASIGAFSGAVGSRMRIRPKGVDTDKFEVAGNLFTLIAAGTGNTKTGILTAALHPLESIQNDYNNAYEKELFAYKQKVASLKAKEKDFVDKPDSTKVLVNDCTVESLHEILSRTPTGVLMVRDELLSLLKSFETKGYEQARGFYCSAWNGVNSYTVDRITRGTVVGKNMCLSVMGAITKERLIDFVHKSKSDFDDGLVERFQMLVFLGEPLKYASKQVVVEPGIDERLKETYLRVINQDRSVFRHAPTVLKDSFSYILYTFTDEVQVEVDYWYDETWYDYLKANSGTAKGDRLNKYKSLAPKLAMLFQILDDIESESYNRVNPVNWHRALWWIKELDDQADELTVTTEQLCIEKLRKVFADQHFTVREALRRRIFGMDQTAIRVRFELSELIAKGYIEQEGSQYRVLTDKKVIMKRHFSPFSENDQASFIDTIPLIETTRNYQKLRFTDDQKRYALLCALTSNSMMDYGMPDFKTFELVRWGRGKHQYGYCCLDFKLDLYKYNETGAKAYASLKLKDLINEEPKLNCPQTLDDQSAKALEISKINEARNSMLSFWNKIKGVPYNSCSYLFAKNIAIKASNAVVWKNFLYVPVYNWVNDKKTLVSLQGINEKGKKRFYTGCKLGKGHHHIISNLKIEENVIFCEGFATALAISTVVDFPVVCTFSAANLSDTVNAFKEHYKGITPIIAADNDWSSHVNVGLIEANRCNAKVISPPANLMYRDKPVTDFSDLLLKLGKEKIQELLLDKIEKN